MGERVSALQGSLAPLYRMDEPIFLGEIARHNVLHNLPRIAPVFAGTSPEPRLKVGIEMNFHGSTIRYAALGRNEGLQFTVSGFI